MALATPVPSVILPLRYPWVWLGAGVCALVIVLILALVPMAFPARLPGGDKTLHFLAFAFLALWFMGLFEARRGLQVAAGLAVYGVLIELLQSLTTYRVADPYDVLSDVIGISAGWLLAAAGLRHWCRQVEKWIGAEPA